MLLVGQLCTKIRVKNTRKLNKNCIKNFYWLNHRSHVTLSHNRPPVPSVFIAGERSANEQYFKWSKFSVANSASLNSFTPIFKTLKTRREYENKFKGEFNLKNIRDGFGVKSLAFHFVEGKGNFSKNYFFTKLHLFAL